MAPDINSFIGPDGRWDYSTPGSSGYSIPKIVYNDPSTRPLRVLTVGAGVSGLLMAYQIQKQCQKVEHVIYERNADLGGTWLENRYPGCACDIPSHAYTYPFALNPNWPRFFSYAPDIHAYLHRVAEVFGLRKYITFRTEVTRAEWQDEKGKWIVSLKQTGADGEVVKQWDEECDVFFYATGILNDFKWPDIPGLNSFKGRVIHTARWDEKYQKEEWAKDRVAVIGSGASSIQTVPTMQPHVKHMDVFVRTGVWFVQIANNFGQNKEYDAEEQEAFRRDPEVMVKHAKNIEDQVNGMWSLFYADSEAQKGAQELFRKRMREFIKDERLLEGFTPKFAVGCKSSVLFLKRKDMERMSC
jgi:cation diffusion facilitator CzcD-associated flavoprotein CzcO